MSDCIFERTCEVVAKKIAKAPTRDSHWRAVQELNRAEEALRGISVPRGERRRISDLLRDLESARGLVATRFG